MFILAGLTAIFTAFSKWRDRRNAGGANGAGAEPTYRGTGPNR